MRDADGIAETPVASEQDRSGAVLSTPLAQRDADMRTTAYDIERPPLQASAQPAADPLIGRRIDHYEIRGFLGEGGMGTVYLAHDLSLERPVAIKVLRRELAAEKDLVERLVIEARAQARLQHPHVVTIYYIGNHEGAPYFVMEYVGGRTVSDQIAQHGPLGWAEALEYIIQTTRALMSAYKRGVIHRDIKPSNLLMNGRTDGTRFAEIKVADFGLAMRLGTKDEQFVGSPYYSAPEQIVGAAPSPQADMYSLGVTFYELLTGEPPFRAERLKDIYRLHKSAPRPQIPASRAPWRLRALINVMMDPDPAKRPASYDDLIARLDALRPKPAIAGGMIARGMALSVDLMLPTLLGQALATWQVVEQRVATEISFLLFGIYYVLAHRFFGKTLGKRLLGLRIQGTSRPITVQGLVARFVVAFWGPLTAMVVIHLQLGAVTDLETVKIQLTEMVGMRRFPLFQGSTEGLLRSVLVPNLVLSIPWVAGFLYAAFDRHRQALHDRVARTRVVYEPRGPERERA